MWHKEAITIGIFVYYPGKNGQGELVILIKKDIRCEVDLTLSREAPAYMVIKFGRKPLFKLS